MLRFQPYKYVKDESFGSPFREINWNFFARTKLISTMLITLGLALFVSQVIIPVYFFKTADVIAKPLTDSIAGAVTGFSDFEFKELSNTGQTSEVKNNSEGNVPEFFYITIPKLNIKDAMVETSPKSLNPDTALGHYPNTGLPGETGNIFIYGHSVLPMFYNPRNYKSIFSTLGDLNTGDAVSLNYNNREYKYLVENRSIVEPEKVDPIKELKPAYLNESTLTLMTCWPAGTKTKRILVNAIQIQAE
jgi:LPXTG-site transpeptidase (sortase) family protein